MQGFPDGGFLVVGASCVPSLDRPFLCCNSTHTLGAHRHNLPATVGTVTARERRTNALSLLATHLCGHGWEPHTSGLRFPAPCHVPSRTHTWSPEFEYDCFAYVLGVRASSAQLAYSCKLWTSGTPPMLLNGLVHTHPHTLDPQAPQVPTRDDYSGLSRKLGKPGICGHCLLKGYTPGLAAGWP